MRVLVSGGAGYIGSACLRWLLRNGHEAFALDNLSTGNRASLPSDHLAVIDLLDPEAVSNCIRVFQPDAIMHFAAKASVPESIDDPDGYYACNLIGTKVLLDAARSASVRKFVFSSTAAVYGHGAECPINETAPLYPAVPYGRSKLAAEWLIRDYCRAYNIGCVVFRYFNASGAELDGSHGESRSRETHLIPLALAAALDRQDHLLIYGDQFATADGTCIRDYVHILDLAQAHQLGVERSRPGEERIYNLGSGRGYSVLEVHRACESVVGRPIPFKIVAPRHGDPAVLVASCEKAKQELGWRPALEDLESIVSTAWRWHQANPDGYGFQ